MKSIIEEASSLGKAIEQGWAKAGKPKKFSVKVLEEAQKNFFGFTVKSAKIAFMFEDEEKAPRAPQKNYREERTERPMRQERTDRVERQEREQRTTQRLAEQKPKRTERQERTEKAFERSNNPYGSEMPETRNESFEAAEPRQPRVTERAPREQRVLWSDDMISSVHDWIQTTLLSMERSDITFTVEVQGYYLRIVLSQPILPEADREKHLLASFATLIMETLRKKAKSGLRGQKIILTHPKDVRDFTNED